MSFVVAGVTGNVGSVVAAELLAKGQKVKVLVRDAAKGAEWSKKGAEVVVAGLGDKDALAAALAGAQGFFVLLPPNVAAPDFYAYQRETSDSIVAAVKASGVPHVVLLSSVGADLPDGTGPIKGLHHLENALRATGVTLTAIRAGYFQENVANSLAPAKNAGIFPNFTGAPDYPFPHIATKDIGTLAAVSLLEGGQKSEIIDLHGPAYSVRQVAEKLGAALGKALQVVDIPPEAHVSTLVQAGLRQDHAEIFAEMYRGFQSGAIAPRGDRLVEGKTPIDEVIQALVRS
ncbi:NmrA family NAD(P)-binding protein [Polyangium sp. y55x31]|uniref:NmrA family NAD(P)-binding protein n=1 Tax=Polyangium sp. y55x31 TaxID=3042688 RepID=UPI0024822B31|nr:NmrA family NAD(P)-binding protein [Polyangium sp. y55x31]MDI1484251.1 NmrA family NAD(P)-binding protein [Polyangium sp. y55x31]